MDLYDLFSPVESMLAAKADIMRQPLGGTMELTPLCNMNCEMCYVRQDKKEMESRGRMLETAEWLHIAKEAKDSGVLYLLLTGGEPLVYPDFKNLYTELCQMGFIITINTNGTLIDEEMADLFAKYPCRCLNITLYGKDDETYGSLCKNPKGFSQVEKALGLLSERKVTFRFNCSLTPKNVKEIEEIAEYAKKWGAALRTASYMFPPLRRENLEFTRLSPEEAAEAGLKVFRCTNGNVNMVTTAKNTLRLLEKENKELKHEGISCRAGRSGFWMTWNGDLLPCGMFTNPRISLSDHSFEEAWRYIADETAKITVCEDCKKCDKRNLCKMCAATCLTETGSFSKKPEYLCQMTERYIDCLKTWTKG